VPDDFSEVGRRALKKVAWRFLPILTLAYVLNYLDRTSVGFAALTMNREIGLSAYQFGWGAGLLFASYALCEIPSNLILYRLGARRWIARIMISWGIVAAANAFVVGPQSFYVVRLLLGAPGRALGSRLVGRTASSDYAASAETMRPTFVRLVNDDLTGLLPEIRASTLLIWGDQDADTPLSDGETMERLIPDAGLVVFEGAGHFSYADQPQRFARVAGHFLGRVGAEPAPASASAS
jgi:pimeloyl-ACP methyl ester carboxylesterase